MHGSLLEQRCVQSHQVMPVTKDYSLSERCQCCHSPALLRPNIVWFGEIPMHMTAIERALFEADIFIAIGTSGNVYPAAGFVDLARQFGVNTVELNLEASARQSAFDEGHYGPASTVVPQFLATL